MKFKSVFIALCVAFLFGSCAINKGKPLSKKEVHVVLLGGQSNMVGHGDYDKLDNALKLRIKKVAQRVLLSTSNNPKVEPKPLSYYITEKTSKYNFDKHFGPELFIGLTLAEAHPNQEYLLIKKAVGGTSLYGAWRADWTNESAKAAERGIERQTMQLYKTHVNNIETQLSRLKSKGKAYKIIGMAWMQGEADTNKDFTASSYGENLTSLVRSYRKQFNISKMPFVIGQVNVLPRKYKAGPDLVRSSMQFLANSDKNIDIVNTSIDGKWTDYPKHTDNLHYNAEGQKRLGIALGEKLLKLSK